MSAKTFDPPSHAAAVGYVRDVLEQTGDGAGAVLAEVLAGRKVAGPYLHAAIAADASGAHASRYSFGGAVGTWGRSDGEWWWRLHRPAFLPGKPNPLSRLRGTEPTAERAEARLDGELYALGWTLMPRSEPTPEPQAALTTGEVADGGILLLERGTPTHRSTDDGVTWTPIQPDDTGAEIVQSIDHGAPEVGTEGWMVLTLPNGSTISVRAGSIALSMSGPAGGGGNEAVPMQGSFQATMRNVTSPLTPAEFLTEPNPFVERTRAVVQRAAARMRRDMERELRRAERDIETQRMRLGNATGKTSEIIRGLLTATRIGDRLLLGTDARPSENIRPKRTRPRDRRAWWDQ